MPGFLLIVLKFNFLLPYFSERLSKNGPEVVLDEVSEAEAWSKKNSGFLTSTSTSTDKLERRISEEGEATEERNPSGSWPNFSQEPRFFEFSFRQMSVLFFFTVKGGRG